MMDLLYLLITAAAFLACWGLLLLCEKLTEE
jgi:hypothetical protein